MLKLSAEVLAYLIAGGMKGSTNKCRKGKKGIQICVEGDFHAMKGRAPFLNFVGCKHPCGWFDTTKMSCCTFVVLSDRLPTTNKSKR